MIKRIYLDHSATTPVDKKVLAAMLPYFNNKFGNPASLHNFGQEASAGIDSARGKIADYLNCQPEEIIFTSGATESDNLAIGGVTKALKIKTSKKLHIITSKIEHPAVLEPFRKLEKEGIEVTYLAVDKKGIVDPVNFKNALRDNTVFASIMYVNSEIGSVQPIREIGKIIEQVNQERKKKNNSVKTASDNPALNNDLCLPLYFHTDAVQAVNFFNCDVKYLHVDLLSLSGHKIYGPKGVGVLYVKSGTPLSAMQSGGHQERNYRSGTLNAAGIVGLGRAMELCKINKEKNNKKISGLRKILVDGVKDSVPNIVLNTDLNNSTPAHAHFSFLGAEGESILIALDLAGIAVATGSACASGSLKPSHVLLAMGIKQEVAHNSIRFTLGKDTTKEQIEKTISVLPRIVKNLRKMSPEYEMLK